jgi:hypothetical protein
MRSFACCGDQFCAHRHRGKKQRLKPDAVRQETRRKWAEVDLMLDIIDAVLAENDRDKWMQRAVALESSIKSSQYMTLVKNIMNYFFTASFAESTINQVVDAIKAIKQHQPAAVSSHLCTSCSSLHHRHKKAKLQ